MTKDVISLSISVLLLFRHYISHKITFGAPSSGGVLCSACGAFISKEKNGYNENAGLRALIQCILFVWSSTKFVQTREPKMALLPFSCHYM